MVDLVGIAPLDVALRCFGQRGFKVQDLLRFSLRCFGLIAQELQHVCQVSNILFPGFDTLVVGAKVVILLRKPEAALVDVGDFAGRVFEILLGAVIEEDANAHAIEMSDERGQLLPGLESGDAIQFRLDGGQAALVDGIGIHAGGVVVADLLLVGASGGVRGCRFFDDLMQRLGVELEKVGELIELRQIGGDGMQFCEVAAGVLIEVAAGIGGFIHGGGVEAGDGAVLRSFAGGSRGLRGAGEGDKEQTAGGGQQGIAHESPPESKQLIPDGRGVERRRGCDAARFVVSGHRIGGEAPEGMEGKADSALSFGAGQGGTASFVRCKLWGWYAAE